MSESPLPDGGSGAIGGASYGRGFGVSPTAGISALVGYAGRDDPPRCFCSMPSSDPLCSWSPPVGLLRTGVAVDRAPKADERL